MAVLDAAAHDGKLSAHTVAIIVPPFISFTAAWKNKHKGSFNNDAETLVTKSVVTDGRAIGRYSMLKLPHYITSLRCVTTDTYFRYW